MAMHDHPLYDAPWAQHITTEEGHASLDGVDAFLQRSTERGRGGTFPSLDVHLPDLGEAFLHRTAMAGLPEHMDGGRSLAGSRHST